MALETIGQDPASVQLATSREIAHMSNAQAVARIDSLREAAVRTADDGDMRGARAFWSNACEIAQHNYVCVDVIAEYADFLESQSLPGYAELYRSEHRQLTEMLAEYDLPFPGYEDRLRAANGEPSQQGSRAHLRLVDEASDARSTSERMGTVVGTRAPTQTRDQ